MIKTPINQVRMTNVAVVRYFWKSGKMRFEIACYKNKVIDWRNGKETDISQVLQSEGVFTNVSKGEMARQKDLSSAFGEMKYQDIVAEILAKGHFQVSELERESKLDAIRKDIAKIVSEKTINPTNNKPYPLSMIEKAMDSINFNVNLRQAPKVQALILIKKLADVIPIQRQKLTIKITIEQEDQEQFEKWVGGLSKSEDEMKLIKKDYLGKEIVFSYSIQPQLFKELSIDLKSLLEDASIELQEQGGRGAEEIKEEAPLDEEEKQIDQILDGQQAAGEVMKKAEQAMREQPKQLKCGSCLDTVFQTSADFREHFKSAWHRYNLARKMNGEVALSEEAYQEAELERMHDDLLLGEEIRPKKGKKGAKRKKEEPLPSGALKIVDKYNQEGEGGKKKKKQKKKKGARQEVEEVKAEEAPAEEEEDDEEEEDERRPGGLKVLRAFRDSEDEEDEENEED